MATNLRQKQPRFEKGTPYAKRNKVQKLYVLVTIVNRDASDVFIDFYRTLESNFQIVFYGKGTATKEIATYLGLSEVNKDIVLSIIREDRVKEALDYINRRFQVSKRHKGVAFTIKMQSIIGVSVYKFLSNTTKEGKTYERE
jgi:hypothetical protein